MEAASRRIETVVAQLLASSSGQDEVLGGYEFPEKGCSSDGVNRNGWRGKLPNSSSPGMERRMREERQESRAWKEPMMRRRHSCKRQQQDMEEAGEQGGGNSKGVGIESLPVGGGLEEQGLRALGNSLLAYDSSNSQRGILLPAASSRAFSNVGSVESPPASSENCIFCKIVGGKAPAFKLYEDEFCVCILDINPLSHGHSLVIPKLHYKSLQSTPPRVAAAMCAAVPMISTALLEATNCDSFNMVVNSGAAAGQVVYHTHYHIIPRFDGDGLWHSESAPRRPFMGAKEAKSFVRLVQKRLAYL